MEKNITIEDKAKAYDEAVKEASIAYKDEDRHLKAVLERIFPELADSKDERIRKAIIKFLIDVNNGAYRKSELEIASWIAWLEKQGQNKLIDKVEPKFKVGDKVYALRNRFECTIESMDETTYYGDTTNFDIKDQDNWKLVEQKSVDKIEPKFKVGDFIVNYYCMGKVIELTNDAYLLDSGQGIPFSCEHNAHLWTIEDAQDGDLIYVSTEEKGIQAIFHEYKDKTIFFHCYLCSDFEQGGYMPIGSVELVYPLQKTHYKRFFEKMHEAGYEWNAEKKESKKIEDEPENFKRQVISEMADLVKDYIQHKPAEWSEEKPAKEIEPFEAEHGKYYYCIKDYFCGGKKQASKGDVVQALRGLPIMGLKDASEYFLPVNSIKCNSTWSEEDEAIYDGIIETELYMLDVVNGIKKFDVGNVSIKEECTRELNWLRSFYNDLIKNYRDYENKEI